MILVNGGERRLDAPVTVEHLVQEMGRDPRGTAVAVNGSVVPRSSWAQTTVADGDRVEILGAVGGG